jgi:hypothetical protein
LGVLLLLLLLLLLLCATQLFSHKREMNDGTCMNDVG